MSVWMTTAGASGSEPSWDLLEFPVTSARAYADVDGVRVSLPKRALVRTDRGNRGFIRTVGENYVLVRHGEFFGHVHEAVASRHRILDVETLVGGSGASARVTWTLYVGGGEPEEWLRQLVAYNGYDGRTAMRIETGGRRSRDGTEMRLPGHDLVCRHRGSGLDAEGVDERVGRILALDPTSEWLRWADVAYGRARFEGFLDTTHLGLKARVEVLHRFMIACPGNLWGAYAALAWYASHGVWSRTPSRTLARRERVHAEARRLVEEA